MRFDMKTSDPESILKIIKEEAPYLPSQSDNCHNLGIGQRRSKAGTYRQGDTGVNDLCLKLDAILISYVDVNEFPTGDD
jgi:hypothetical protein